MPLACVHSDLLGPITPSSIGGKKYIMSFIDDFSRFGALYFLRSKDEAFSAFQHFQSWVEPNTGFKILKFKTDRGGEYSSTEFLKYLRDHAIDIERGPARRPTANSVAERYFRTLLACIRTQFVQSGLPLSLWAELAAYCCLQLNCSPTVALDDDTPLSVFQSHCKGHVHPLRPNRFKPFGCLAYVHNQDAKKLAPTAKRMIFVGLEAGSNAARLWDRTTGKILISSNVTFDESVFPARSEDKSPTTQQLDDFFSDTLFFPPDLPVPSDRPITPPSEPLVAPTQSPVSLDTQLAVLFPEDSPQNHPPSAQPNILTTSEILSSEEPDFVALPS